MPNPPHVLSVDAGLLDAMDLFFSTITTATSATTATVATPATVIAAVWAEESPSLPVIEESQIK